MVESAALLVDDVLPQEPMRQWVLSVAFPLSSFFFFALSRVRDFQSCYPILHTLLDQRQRLVKCLSGLLIRIVYILITPFAQALHFAARRRIDPINGPLVPGLHNQYQFGINNQILVQLPSTVIGNIQTAIAHQFHGMLNGRKTDQCTDARGADCNSGFRAKPLAQQRLSHRAATNVADTNNQYMPDHHCVLGTQHILVM